MFTVLRNTSEPTLGEPERESKRMVTKGKEGYRLGSCSYDLVVSPPKVCRGFFRCFASVVPQLPAPWWGEFPSRRNSHQSFPFKQSESCFFTNYLPASSYNLALFSDASPCILSVPLYFSVMFCKAFVQRRENQLSVQLIFQIIFLT